jgi:hypothetical protein
MHLIARFALIASLSLASVFAFAQDVPDAASPDPASASSATAASAIESNADRLASPRASLVGQWEEFSPSRNFVDFFEDGRVVLYLKRGEIGDLKELEGTWTLDDANNFSVEFGVNGQRIVQSAKLSFENDEMLLIDDKGATSRHRKRNGPLPEDYRW